MGLPRLLVAVPPTTLLIDDTLNIPAHAPDCPVYVLLPVSIVVPVPICPTVPIPEIILGTVNELFRKKASVPLLVTFPDPNVPVVPLLPMTKMLLVPIEVLA